MPCCPGRPGRPLTPTSPGGPSFPVIRKSVGEQKRHYHQIQTQAENFVNISALDSCKRSLADVSQPGCTDYCLGLQLLNSNVPPHRHPVQFIEKLSSSRSMSTSHHPSKTQHTWDSCTSSFPSDPMWSRFSFMSWVTLGSFFSFAAQTSRGAWISLRNSSCTNR